MKKSTLLITALFLLISFSCKKQELLSNFDNLGVGSYLTLTKKNNLTIDFANQATSKVSIEVGSKGSAVDKVNIYVVDGASLDKTKWKLVKTVPFAEGVTLEVSAVEIKTALGVNIKPGSTYTLYNEIVTKDGRKFSSANIDPDFEAQAGYNMAMSWVATTTCPYDGTVFTGTFFITKDTWQDFNIGDPVQVQTGPGANQITIFVYPSPAFGTNRRGVVLNVNAATGNVTIPTQIVGDYPPDTDITMEGVGTVNSCQKLITLTGIKFGQGGVILYPGPYQLTLKQ